jgi:hypothetical protein
LRVFRSNGAVRIDEHIIGKLADKHPHDPSRQFIPADTSIKDTINRERQQVELILKEELDQYMRTWTDPSTATDSSGWTDSDLVHAYFKCEYFRDVLRYVITALIRASPELFVDPDFFSRTGMALRKPTVELAVRPVTWDNSILKLAEGFIHHTFSAKIYSKLDSCQVSGLSGGV